MATKKEQLTRMSQKHDIEAHWKLAENFIPMVGEIIVYDPDETHDYARFKCGDGVTYVNDLPFIFKIDENYATKEYVDDAVANITIEVDNTLTKEGEAADAKAVGDAMTHLFINMINNANDAELFYLMEDGTIITDKQALQEKFGITTDIFYHVVDAFPDNHAICTLTENHIYILRGTGIGYIDVGNGVQSLAERMGIPTAGLEQRWSPDINMETATGIYAIPKVTTVRTVSTLPQYGVVDQLFKKQESGLTLLYMSNGVVGTWLPVFNALPGFASDDGSTPFVPFSSAEYHLINSLDSTDGCIQMVPNSGGTVHFYIDATTGLPYLAASDRFVPAQLFATARGWTKDIETETEDGVYAAYTNLGEAEYYRFNGHSWRRLDTAIVDSKSLPRENIDTHLIYRIPSKAALYIVEGQGSYTSLETYAAGMYNIHTELVEELPAILTLTDMDGTDVYLYVVRETGIAYADVGYGAMTLGYMLSETNGLDCGWSADIATETSIGFFTVVTETLQYIYNGTSWSILADDKYLDATLFDIIELEPQHVGDTVRWDGVINSTTVKTDDVPYYGETVLTYVKVSDSVPTVSDLAAGVTGKLIQLGEALEGDLTYVLQEDGAISLINAHNSDTIPVAGIIPADNYSIDGIVFPQAGVYVIYINLGDAGRTWLSELTIPGYDFVVNGSTKKIIKPELIELADNVITEEKLFDTIGTPSEYVGDTVYWNGDLDTENAIFIIEGDYVGSHIKQYGIKVSDSVPTYNEINNNWSGTHSWGGEFPHESSSFNHVDEHDSYISIYSGSDSEYSVIIVKDTMVFNGVKATPGTYLVHSLATDLETGTDRSHYATSFTISGYNFLSVDNVKKTIKEEFLPESVITETRLFDTVSAPSEYIGETLTWDGDLEGKTYSGYTVQVNGVTQEMMYIKVSDSVPTIEDLETNGWCVTTAAGNTMDQDHPNLGPTNAGVGMFIYETEQYIRCTDLDGWDPVMCFPTIVKKSWNVHAEINLDDFGEEALLTFEGVPVLEPGVYFFKGSFILPNKIENFQTESFTLNNYNFLSAGDVKKIIKPELIFVDSTLTQEGYAADAKAVGDKIAAINIPSSLADLSQDTTHRTVTDTEKETWNAKSNFSGSYNDLTDKPTIPSIEGLATETYVDNKVASIVDSSPETLDTLNELAKALGEDPNFATTVATEIGKKADKSSLATVATSGSYNDLTDKPTIPTKASELINDSKYVTEDVINGKYSKGLAYSLENDGTYAVSGIGTCTDINIVIPSVVDGYRVTKIAPDAFKDSATIISIIIPDSVTSIGGYAFESCTSLKSIDIPNSVTTIGDRVFRYCESLTSATIPDSVTTIGDCVFGRCVGLTSATIGDSITTISNQMFIYCAKLTSVTIGSSVTAINSWAFTDCNNLTSITIPNFVTTIGERAFSGCSSLTIYCETESQPEGWDANWNRDNRPVVWGFVPNLVGVNKKLNDIEQSITNNAVIINSSTEGSTKRFKITVDDSGTITATEVT